MGDSYSAGNGAGAYYGPAGCRRSSDNYASLFARALAAAPYDQPTTVRNVACSGDTTHDIFSPKRTSLPLFQGSSTNPPQIDAVSRSYGLIFLTIGGNDLDFAKIVQDCLLPPFLAGRDCRALLSAAERKLSDHELKNDVMNVLSQIGTGASSQAKIVLLGYPYLEGNPNFSIPSGSVTAPILRVGRDLEEIEDLGDVLAQQIVSQLNSAEHSARYVFVNTKSLFAGPHYPTGCVPEISSSCHELFADKLNHHRWLIEPGVDAGPADYDIWYHPNPLGWEHEAQLLLGDPRIPKHPATVPAGGGGTPGSGAGPVAGAPTPAAPPPAAPSTLRLPAGARPGAIAATSDGHLWALDQQAPTLYEAAPSGTVTSHPLPPAYSYRGLVAGTDGRLWTTQSSAADGEDFLAVGRDGSVTTYPYPLMEPSANPSLGVPGTDSLTVGADGNIWFVGSWNKYLSGDVDEPLPAVGEITPDGTVSLHVWAEQMTCPEYDGAGFGIGTAAAGVAFGTSWGSADACNPGSPFTPFLESVSVYHAPPALDPFVNAVTNQTSSGRLITDGTNDLWWIDEGYNDGDTLDELAASGALQTYALPVSTDRGSETPAGLAFASDGSLWFTFGWSQESQLGQYTAASGVVAYELPAGADPVDVTTAPDGSVWVSESGPGILQRVDP